MTIEQIKDKLKSKEYDFLRTDKNLGNNIIILTLGGSHAYGTNNEGSDLDIRGCALNSKMQILTNENFEQFVNNETDTTIYAFNKLVALLSNTNPNTIEMLGNKPEHCKCKMEYHSDFLFNTKDAIPKCECGGLIRPDVTLYGENLPNEAVNGAIRAIRDAEMLIIGGTSLKVYPAAHYISYFSGRHLVVINKEKIQVLLYGDTDLMIVDSLGNVFNEIDKWM